MKIESLVIMSLVAMNGMAGQVSAQDKDAAELDLAHDGTRITVGLGAGVAPDYEGSNDYEATPFPLLRVKFENDMSISITGNHGKVNLFPNENWRAGLAFEYIRERDDVDNDRVDAMRDIDDSLMAGGFVGYETEKWLAGIEALTDVSDSSDGTIVRLRGGFKLPSTGDCTATINVYTTWADNDYMDTYFGISNADSAASGLSAFQADEGFKDIGVTLKADWKASDKWSVFSLVGYKLLLDDADDSPIVDEGDSNQFFGGIGLAYRF